MAYRSIALKSWLRKSQYAPPCRVLVPLLVTVFTTPPVARPYSGVKFEEMTWNSCTASCESWLWMRVRPAFSL